MLDDIGTMLPDQQQVLTGARQFFGMLPITKLVSWTLPQPDGHSEHRLSMAAAGNIAMYRLATNRERRGLDARYIRGHSHNHALCSCDRSGQASPVEAAAARSRNKPATNLPQRLEKDGNEGSP
jgi:hypothetical protein